MTDPAVRPNRLRAVISNLEQIATVYGNNIEVYVMDRESGEQTLKLVTVREYQHSGPLVVVLE